MMLVLQSSCICPAAAIVTLSPALKSQGITFGVDVTNAPSAAESGTWRQQAKVGTCAGTNGQLQFHLEQSGKSVCHATVAGWTGLPTRTIEAKEETYDPLRSRRTLQLVSLCTLDECRRRGYASALLEAIFEWLREAYTPADVGVVYLNDKSMTKGFYTSRGWRSLDSDRVLSLTRTIW
jgi:GNAT superfamily N-acetyltransferase